VCVCVCVCVCVRVETPLTLAVTDVHQPLALMTVLVEGGAHLDYRNVLYQTPMHKAALTGRQEPVQVRLLLLAASG